MSFVKGMSRLGECRFISILYELWPKTVEIRVLFSTQYFSIDIVCIFLNLSLLNLYTIKDSTNKIAWFTCNIIIELSLVEQKHLLWQFQSWWVNRWPCCRPPPPPGSSLVWSSSCRNHWTVWVRLLQKAIRVQNLVLE